MSKPYGQDSSGKFRRGKRSHGDRDKPKCLDRPWYATLPLNEYDATVGLTAVAGGIAVQSIGTFFNLPEQITKASVLLIFPGLYQVVAYFGAELGDPNEHKTPWWAYLPGYEEDLMIGVALTGGGIAVQVGAAAFAEVLLPMGLQMSASKAALALFLPGAYLLTAKGLNVFAGILKFINNPVDTTKDVVTERAESWWDSIKHPTKLWDRVSNSPGEAGVLISMGGALTPFFPPAGMYIAAALVGDTDDMKRTVEEKTNPCLRKKKKLF